MKTEKVEKVDKDKKYYTHFGKIKIVAILNTYLKFLFLAFIANFLSFIYNFHYFYKGSFFSYIQFIYNNFFNFFHQAFHIYEKAFFQNDFNVFFITFKFFNYTLFISIILFFLLNLFFIYIVKKANLLAKLSSCDLENYKVSFSKKGVIFKVKRGELLDINKFSDSNLDRIKQIFKIEKDIIVEKFKKTGFILKYINFPEKKLEVKDLQKEKIFFGFDKNGKKVYFDVSKLTHFLIVGESGSGKSVFQNLLISSFLFNLNKGIEKLFLVDLKGGVEFNQYNVFNNVTVVSDVTQFFELSNELLEIMDKRYNFMLENGIKNYQDNQIIVMIDEYASVNDQSSLLEKEDAKVFLKNIRTLIAKARAAGIKFFIATQKATSDSIDTTVRENLQSRILMKSKSKDAQNAVISRDLIAEKGVNPALFGKGRFLLFFDTYFELIQAPFVEDDFYKKLDIKKKDNVKEIKKEDKKDNIIKDNKEIKKEEVKEDKKNEEEEKKEDKKNEIVNNIDEKKNDENDDNNSLEFYIKKRKSLYKRTSKIEDPNVRKNLFKKLRIIKYIQETENKKCSDDLNEIEKQIKI